MNKQTETIKPITRCLMTIGQLPSSYLVSMTYEEQLLWLCNFLKTEVIPKTNENIEAVNELIKYIDDYFDNLDVQEEVNEKLDEMAESGELTELIAEYLNTNAIIGFNTLSDLENAENLVDGSFARTLGKITIDDGYGYFYKIREITNQDVVDNENIVALTNFNTLIAQKIDGVTFNYVDSAINDLDDEKEDKLTELVIFGDSWADPIYDGNQWVTQLNKHLNLTVHNYAKSGAGFCFGNPNTNLISAQITTFNADTTYDKSKIKYIIIMAGVNDYRNNTTIGDLKTECGNILNSLSNTYKQAKVLYINNIEYPYTLVQSAYFKELEQYLAAGWGGITLNIDTIVGYQLFNNTYFHLSQAGYRWLARNILASLTGGEIIHYKDIREIDETTFNLLICTERLGNMIIQHFTFTPKSASTTYEATQPTQKIPYYNDYAQGFITAFQSAGLILNRNDKVALTFAAAPNTTYVYYFTRTLYIPTP